METHWELRRNTFDCIVVVKIASVKKGEEVVLRFPAKLDLLAKIC